MFFHRKSAALVGSRPPPPPPPNDTANVPVICFFFPFPCNGTDLVPFSCNVLLPVTTYGKGVWSKLIIKSLGMLCQACTWRIFRWKSSFVSDKSADATGTLAVVAIRRVIFRPMVSIRYKTFLAQSLDKDKWQMTNETVFAEKETNKTALEIDPYSIAWTKKNKSKLTSDTVGHIPKEISRTVFFFISRGGKVVGKVLEEKCYPSPIPKGGLEILLIAQFKIADGKTKLLGALERNYCK